MIHQNRLSKVFFLTGTLFFLSCSALVFVKEILPKLPDRWSQFLEQKEFEPFSVESFTIYKNDYFDAETYKEYLDAEYPEEGYRDPDWLMEFRDRKDGIAYFSYQNIINLRALRPISPLRISDGLELPADVMSDDFDGIIYFKEKPLVKFSKINFKKQLTDEYGIQRDSFKMVSDDGRVVGYLKINIKNRIATVAAE